MIWLILLSVAFVPPFWVLLPDFGIARQWGMTAVVPICALILLYPMAFGPGREGGRRR